MANSIETTKFNNKYNFSLARNMGTGFHEDLNTFAIASSEVRTWQQISKGMMILLWTGTYVMVIIAGFQSKTCAIGRGVLAYNMVWEIVRTFIYNKSDKKWLVALFGVGWLGLDCVIVSLFWLYGNGDPALPLQTQHSQFLLWFGFWVLTFAAADRCGAGVARIWRHMSAVATFPICETLLRSAFAYGYSNPFLYPISWCNFIGNIFSIMGVAASYSKWHHPRRHPIRFIMVTLAFFPTVIYGLYVIGVAGGWIKWVKWW